MSALDTEQDAWVLLGWHGQRHIQHLTGSVALHGWSDGAITSSAATGGSCDLQASVEACERMWSDDKLPLTDSQDQW